MDEGVSQDYVFGEWLFESSIKILKCDVDSQYMKPLNKACFCGVPLTMTIPAQGTNSLKFTNSHPSGKPKINKEAKTWLQLETPGQS